MNKLPHPQGLEVHYVREKHLNPVLNDDFIKSGCKRNFK